MASPICFRLLTHWERRAASRAACTAGSSRAIRTAMIAITTSSSIRVKPRFILLIRKTPLEYVKNDRGKGTGGPDKRCTGLEPEALRGPYVGIENGAASAGTVQPATTEDI